MQQETIEKTLNLQLATAVQADASIVSISTLLAHKADVNSLDESGLPLLYSAINNINPGMVGVLLEAKASIRNVDEISILRYAKLLLTREQSAKDLLTSMRKLAPQHSNLWPLAGSENERIRRLEEIVARLDKRPAFLAGIHSRQVETPLAEMKTRPNFDPHVLKTMLSFMDGRAPQKQPKPRALDLSATAPSDEGSSGLADIEHRQKLELKKPAASPGPGSSEPVSRRKILLSGGVSFASQPAPGDDGAVLRDFGSTIGSRMYDPPSEIVSGLLSFLNEPQMLLLIAPPVAQDFADDLEMDEGMARLNAPD